MTCVGVVGYSSGEFDEELARHYLSVCFDFLMQCYGNIEIVSGLTWQGVPGICYEVAKDKGLKTVGIACSKASEYKCFPVDEVIIVGDNWGEESETFLNRIDVLVRAGGGEQTARETELFKKRRLDAEVLEMDLPRRE